ncbi:MAG: helix-turn-helix domain-containing protein [Bacillota bacterium]
MAKPVFARRLAKLRAARGLSQYRLAELLGFSRGQISNYEQGSREPDHATLQKLADFFDVSIDYLLGRTDDPRLATPIQDLVTAARRLQAIRVSRDWSQQDLASRLGITVPQLARYESGLERLPDELVDRLAEVFEVDRRYFAGEIDQGEIERLLGETWFRAPAKLSPEARKSVEDFIAFVIAQEERKKRQEKQQGQQQ